MSASHRGSHPEGHRERLRLRFRSDPDTLTEADILELLLTYAIPRRNVSLLAKSLLERFGSISAVLTAPEEALMEVDGVGESAALFIQVVNAAYQADNQMKKTQPRDPSLQLSFFEKEPGKSSTADEDLNPKERVMRVFANDEVANSLEFLPRAAGFETLEQFRLFLVGKLPYNAEATRIRRASYFLDRYYPGGLIDTPLTYYAAHCSSETDLKPVVFYHILKAEPIAERVAEELIWPSLPIGRVEREQVREFTLRYLPEAGMSSQKNMLRSLFYTYEILAVGKVSRSGLHFNLRQGSLEGFLYILTSEYPQPGIYTYESLYDGPAHRWLLWDREWIRRQLYNLRDWGIVSKVSEIDTVKQFTVAVDQKTALHQFYEAMKTKKFALRDNTDTESIKFEDENGA